MINETETRTEEVEMTLAEAIDLQELGWRQGIENRIQSRPYNLFSEVFQFRPHNFTEILSRNSQNPDRYTNGRLFLARKKSGRIEIAPAFMSSGEQSWKIKKEVFRSNLYNNYLDAPGMGGRRGAYTHIFYNFLTDLSTSLFAPYSSALNITRAIDIDGMATIAEIGALPVFEEGDYERFWRTTSPEGFEEMQRTGKRIRIIDPKTLNKGWNFVIPLLTRHLFFTAISRINEEYLDQLTLSGTLSSLREKEQDDPIFRKYWHHVTPIRTTLDGELFQAYVQPKDIGNGVIAMSSDRIPKYLKRRLGFQ
jgi:hypothetical protein